MLIPQQLKEIIGNTYLSLYLSGVYLYIYLFIYGNFHLISSHLLHEISFVRAFLSFGKGG